ncbi:particle complex subunit 8-like isoform X1 [Octopus vulgaris]|uniref:Particle complex subunit 8-like isoform X1 n=1 Tax=Octopus vulgaris TaxID=6645 RepID=A0AA36AIZ7_OCTVU|nr:particle complex subunit 8-like isoform X1 [Octopus vulgaris]
MAQCKQTAQEFIQNTFSPQVAVLCSADAEHLCQKNNLTFVELVQPFCRLNSEAHIRDPNNVLHSIHNLKITVKDLNTPPPQQAVARKMMTDTVASAQPQLLDGNQRNVISVGDYDLQLSATTPWFEAYRECFLHLLPPSDHEFLNHSIACMFVVSSGHTDPVGVFNTLSQQQSQQHNQFPNKLPKWFCPNILKYYVLLHDVVEGEQAKAEAVYQSMKTTFGAHLCHLLQINSRSVQTAETFKNDQNMPDPWSQFLHRAPESNVISPLAEKQKPQKATFRYFITWEGADYDVPENNLLNIQDEFSTQLNESTNQPIEQNSNEQVETAVEAMESKQYGTNEQVGLINSPNSSKIFDHPLAEESRSLNGSMNTINALSPDGSGAAISGVATTTGGHFIISPTEKPKSDQHGMCLTISDHDRLRIFMHEFCVRALIPWAERQMRVLNDQLTSRKGFHRSFFSATRKIFGGKPTGQMVTSQNTTVVYTTEAPELQMRRLADLAFLFQIYDFAYHTYQTAKRDFNNDHAWLHYAGALEMACITLFMQDNGRQYPHHYMESAVTTYLATCRNPQLAARGTLISTEALKSKGMYGEAAMQFIKMISEQDSDLRSALLLEQAAHCYIKKRPPMARKYAFHMILAGHRFSKSGQKKHALRSYSQALQVYKGKHWSLAEDHINFIIGRQSFNLKQLENATAAFKHLLTADSCQTTAQQAAFLKEYLFVYKQLLGQSLNEGTLYPGPLPELPLPTVDSNVTKVLLCNTVTPRTISEVNPVLVGVCMSQEDTENEKWFELEKQLVLSTCNGGSLPLNFRPSLHCFTDSTDNKFNPIGFVGEKVSVEVHLVNPLKITLLLTDVVLLWTFLPHLPDNQEKSPLITNEVSSVKNKLADEIIHTEVLKEVTLTGNMELPVQLSLTPQQTGELRIVGIAYNLGTNSLQSSNSTNSLILNDGNLTGTTVTTSTSATTPGTGPTRANYSNSINVRGKQRLEVQGPRLNSNKEERASKVYGPDRRLDLVIKQQMPILKVELDKIPETLLCGEVQSITLKFCNDGTIPLKNLKVASNTPSFLALGTDVDLVDSVPFSSIYQTQGEDICGEIPGNEPKEVAMNGIIVIDIPIPNGILKPNFTMTVPMWIRGNDVAGVHTINFLFYYEPVEQDTKIKYRVLRYSAVINTVESLNVQATIQRSRACVQKCSEDKDECFITCELENLNSGQTKAPHLKTIQIKQMSCASRNWSINYLSTPKNTELLIHNRETLQMCLKAIGKRATCCEGESEKSRKVYFSNTHFNETKIKSSKTPCSDFYYKCTQNCDQQSTLISSYSPNTNNKHSKFSDLDTAIEVNLTLIILWQALVVQDSGETVTLVGQHHVTFTKLNKSATSYPVTKQQPDVGPLKFIKDIENIPVPKPSLEVSTHLVHYNFSHESNIKHQFKKKCLCLLPVRMILCNCSRVPVHVLIDTGKSPESYGSLLPTK